MRQRYVLGMATKNFIKRRGKYLQMCELYKVLLKILKHLRQAVGVSLQHQQKLKRKPQNISSIRGLKKQLLLKWIVKPKTTS
jgi:hypothetical protein